MSSEQTWDSSLLVFFFEVTEDLSAKDITADFNQIPARLKNCSISAQMRKSKPSVSRSPVVNKEDVGSWIKTFFL